MKNQIEVSEYKELRHLTQKRFIGYQFVSAAAIGPQIRELLKLDRIPALKYLAICRGMLFDSFRTRLIETKGKKKSKNDELLDRKQMIDLFKITYPTLHAHIKRGIIPKPFYIGSKPRWYRSEIMDYLKSLGEKS